MVTVASVVPPYAFFTDLDGDPLEDGNVYIGTVGLNPLVDANRVAIYADAALTIPIAQPVKTEAGVLVRSGSPTYVYVAGTEYSILIKDKNGRLVYSALNAPQNPQIVTVISTSIRYERSQAEINAGVVPINYYVIWGDINRYGTNAVPGTTDMTAALQAALDVGLTVYIPAGTYLITAACRLKTTQQMVYGDGALSILLTATDIETLYSNTGVFGVVLRDINFKNTVSQAITGMTQFHVHFGTGASGCTIERCYFNTALTGSIVRITHHGGVWFEGANLNNILDCTFGMANILMGSTDSTIRGGFVYSFAHEYAIKVVSAGEVLITGIRGILGGPSKGCIWLAAPGYINKIIDNYFGGTLSTLNIGDGVFGEQQQMLQVIGNTFHEQDKVGVHLIDPASGCVVANNTFWAGYPKQNDPTFATPGYQDILVESSAFGASSVVIIGNVCNRFIGPIEDGMPGVGKSVAIEIKTFGGVANNIIRHNTVSGARYYSPGIVDNNLNDSVGDNGGVQTVFTWVPSDVSGAGLVFTNVTARFIKDFDSITVWCQLTFPATASGAGVSIGGLPQIPLVGMEGAVGALRSDAAAVQKVKLTPGSAFFILTDTVGAQQTNATCSGKTFGFFARYLF